MTIVVNEPVTTESTDFTCDRCGKTERVVIVIPRVPDDVPTAFIADMPEGWQEINFHYEVVQFCKRACTATWLADKVAKLYEEDTPIGKSRIRRERVADAEAQTFPIIEVEAEKAAAIVTFIDGK